MKILLVLLSLSISGLSFAQSVKLGQESDPVGGDNSRCCRTGKCGDNMKLCADTAIDSDRTPKDLNRSSASSKKNRGAKATAQ